MFMILSTNNHQNKIYIYEISSGWFKIKSLCTTCKTYNFASYFISRLWWSHHSRKLVKASILLYTKRLHSTLAIASVSRCIIITVLSSIGYSINIIIAKLNHLHQYKPIRYMISNRVLVILILRFEKWF